ncbi:hypothetical protein [Pseudoxanthomonas dokdonensis]|uniref:hypothetical protein n=1 Tax=Pseudoxanthomonas dokdonensis TaxID=344882 RepID=UPI000B131B71|nr:hypothetical protein [Pseudoxanthomonas dokdonensis]
MNDYPRMLYLGGDTAAAYKIVADADAEKEAGKDGFVRAGEGNKLTTKKPAPTKKGA